MSCSTNYNMHSMIKGVKIFLYFLAYTYVLCLLLFAVVGLVIVCHVTDTPLGKAQTAEMIRYLRNVQRSDGGWGL